MFQTRLLRATLATMALSAIACAALGAQTFTANPNMAIADNTSQSTAQTVALGGTITSLRVDLRINHTWDSDMSIWLIPPGVTVPAAFTGTPPAGVIDLCSGNGGSGDNFGTGAGPFVYTQISSSTDPTTPGTLAITTGTAPFTAGVYIPEGLATFNALYGTSPSGLWTIGIADTATGDQGTLLSWQLAFGVALGDPEIEVQDPSSAATFNGATTNLGNVDVGTNPAFTYTIENAGATQNLTISSIAAAASGVGNVSVTAAPTLNPSGPIAPGGGTATFDVNVSPTALGAFEFTITINNNDADEGTFTIIVQGTGTSPNPAIQAPFPDPVAGAVLITEVSQDPDTSGDEYIELTNVSGANVDTTGWQFTFYPSSSTTPQFTITLTAGVMTPGQTWVICDNNGATAPAFDQFCGVNIGANQNTGHLLRDALGNIVDAAFFGTANPAGITAPVTIGAEWVGATATNCTATAESAKRLGTTDNNDASDWATTTGTNHSLGSANTGLTLPFNVLNSAAIGGADPAWTGALLVGDNLGVTFTATDSSSTQTLSFTITVTGGTLSGAAAGFNESFPFTPAGGTSPHSVSLTGTAAAQGTIEFTVQVSDGALSDTITYTLTITTPQEMDVLRGTTAIADAGTDTVNIVTTGSNLVYTIENTGGLDLNLTGTPLVDVTPGTNVASVTVTANPTSPVAGGGSTNFTINVVPTGVGAYDFAVSIDNNDADENPYTFTVSGNAVTNVPPAVAVGAGNWVDAGGGLFTLTVAPGAAIADTLTATDATPDTMTVTVTNPGTALTGLTAQPVTNGTAVAGPISLTWTGTANATNAPGNYNWTIDINDGTSSTIITARIIVTDVPPAHTAVSGISGDGSGGTPYLTNFAQNDPATVTVNLANVTDANTGQTLNLTNVVRTGGTAVGGSGFTYSLVGGVLSVAPSATLVANDVGTNIYTMDVDDGTNTVTINVTITVFGNSGLISFTNTSPLQSGTVGSVYTTVTLTATGGTGPYTYSLANGTSLPAGLSLSTAGDITGTPTLAGVVVFDVRAVDSTNDSGVATFQITVSTSGGGGGGGGGDGDEGGCSTNGGSSWLVLLGLLGLVALATRVRTSRE